MEQATTETKTLKVKLSSRYKQPLKNRDRHLVLYGGRGSGKSEFAARKIICRCLFEGGHRFLIMRKVRSRCRESIVRVILTILEGFGIVPDHNETKREISFRGFDGRMNVIVYDGLDDPDKIKSIKGITGIWLEETTEFTKQDFTIVDLCLREATETYHQVMMTFNPDESRARWIKQMFFTGIDDGFTGKGAIPNSFIHHSTIKDNPIDEVRNEYLKQLDQLDDPVLKNIYRRGLWAVHRGIIYKHPRIVSIYDYPKEYDLEFYGLDLGFNVPSALIFIGVKDGIVYLRQIIYETHLTTSDLIERMKDKNVNKNITIYADPSAEKDIVEISRAGYKIKAAPGGKGSVYTGIMLVKAQELVTNEEENEELNNEFRTYKWKEDRAGDPVDEPVKFDDHGLDAVRYGIYSKLRPKEKAKFRLSTQDMY